MSDTNKLIVELERVIADPHAYLGNFRVNAEPLARLAKQCRDTLVRLQQLADHSDCLCDVCQEHRAALAGKDGPE